MKSETPSQTRFFDELLCHYPALQRFWNRADRSLDTDAAAAAAVSSGERTALRVLASIWCGSAGEEYQIDFSDVAALSPNFRKPLVQWLCAPFWP